MCVATQNHKKFIKNPIFGGSKSFKVKKHKILSQKTRVLGVAHSKDFVILACTIPIQVQSVMDRQTDRQTDGHPGHG